MRRKRDVFEMAIVSLNQYKAVDVGILTVVGTVAEALCAGAAKIFTWELYSVSPAVAVICIVMMRWGGWAAIPAVTTGAAFCFVTGAEPKQFAAYCVGNCFALLAMLLFKAFGKGKKGLAAGKEKIRSKFYFTAIFVAAAFAGAILGRWLVSVILGSPVDIIYSYFLADSLSLIFAETVVLIARRPDGLFEDQKSYLIRTESERRRYSDPDYYE